jgi:Protein of unknown function (DUF1236)
MRTHRNTMLAGIAALALLAGTGLVSAQDKQDQNAAPQTKQPQATQQMNKGPAADKMGQNAQEPKEQNKGGPAAQKSTQNNAQSSNETKAAAGKRTAQTEQRKPSAKKDTMARRDNVKGDRTAQQNHISRQKTATGERDRAGTERRQTTAQDHRRNSVQERQNTAQGERRDMKGLQGNASGMNVQLSGEQRTQIRSTVLNAQGAPRVGNVNFDVTVGTMIPRGGIHVVPVPQTLVRIEPRWHGFLYFVYQDEIVIVNPRDMRIVAVVPV